MKITEFWTTETMKLLPRLGTSAAAWNALAKTNPDAALLLRAYGATRQSVASFCNSKIFRNRLPMDTEKRRKLQERIQEEIKTRHCDYSVAFNRVYPQFANGDPEQIQTQAGADGVPVRSPGLTALFRLPIDTTTTEWSTVWKANAGKTSPINFGRVFDALCELAQNERGLDYEAALRFTKTRFPNLWQVVQDMAKSVL